MAERDPNKYYFQVEVEASPGEAPIIRYFAINKNLFPSAAGGFDVSGAQQFIWKMLAQPETESEFGKAQSVIEYGDEQGALPGHVSFGSPVGTTNPGSLALNVDFGDFTDVDWWNLKESPGGGGVRVAVPTEIDPNLDFDKVPPAGRAPGGWTEYAEPDLPGAVFRRYLTDPKLGGFARPGLVSGPLANIPRQFGSAGRDILSILQNIGEARGSSEAVRGVLGRMGYPGGTPSFTDFLTAQGLVRGGSGALPEPPTTALRREPGYRLGVPGVAHNVLSELARVPLGGRINDVDNATLMAASDPETEERRGELYRLMGAAAYDTGVSPLQASAYQRADVRQRIMNAWNDQLLSTAGTGTRPTFAQFLANRLGIDYTQFPTTALS
jgi:hypothetical protein